MSTETERKLARALEAALRWPYNEEMIEHVMGKGISENFDPSYIADVHDIRAGVEAAELINERVL